jgi:hypothetical protein
MTFPPAPPAVPNPSDPTGARLPYAPPVLEALGAWSALTLQQSVPITLLANPERSSRLG